VAQDRGQVGLGGQEQLVAQRADAVGTQPHLGGGLLAGDVQRAGPLGEPRGHVEQQGGLAHPRLTRHEDHGARHHAAAEHPVELVHPGRHGPRGLDVDLTDRPGGAADGAGPRRTDRGCGGVGHRAPALALAAPADPLGGQPAALRAPEGRALADR
jgi:hypothetical protein